MYFESYPSFTNSQKVLNSPKPGGTLLLEYDVTRKNNSGCTILITPFIIDGSRVRIEFATFPVPIPDKGGREVFRAQVNIPEKASPGPSIYRPRVEWYCNPYQQWWPRQAKVDDMEFFIRSD
jgi:hypothetical protein